VWSAAAEDYAARGDEALARGRAVTAGEHLRRAALTLQFAQFVITEDEAAREALHRRQVDLYARAAPLLRPPAEQFAVEFEGVSLPGYLRRPAGESAGLVLLIPGLESTKEQFTTYEPYFLERGMATLSFEGPGQGEAWYSLPFRDDAYLRAVAALGEAASSLSRRVVVVGTSFGGYLALRCAAAVPGLAGVVAISGRHDLADFTETEPVVQDGYQRIVKAASREEAIEILSEVTLAGRLDALDAPALVVHGRRDRLVPDEQLERIAAALGERAELWIEPDGNHSCNNLHTRIRPAIADWVRERLEAYA
jgi:2,6-dihydroxypseudooxynicotine hydrolase